MYCADNKNTVKDRLKIYLFIVTFIFIAVHTTSEYFAKDIDKEVEIYNQHVSILYNAHEIIYHITAIQKGIYSLENGTFDDSKPIMTHTKQLEQGIEGISNAISFIFLAGRDDEAFRGYANNTEAIQTLYPKFMVHVNKVLTAKDARERKEQIGEVIEIGERMEFFVSEIDKRIDEEYKAVSTFLPTITSKMRWIRNVAGILFWGVIVLLSVRYFYSCQSYGRILPYLNALKKGEYGCKPQLRDTPCEKEIELAFNAVIERGNDSEKSSSELSIVDQLTGAYNRRYFDIKINEEMSRYMRHGTIFSLSIIDIDFFKKINDTLGHQAGDIILKEIVTVIRYCVRDTDIVTRYGGEEFAILSPYTPKSGVLTLVERLRVSVEGHDFTGLGRPLTISIGVADSAGKSTAEHIIEEADSNLYIAKNSGRNRCVIGGVAAQATA